MPLKSDESNPNPKIIFKPHEVGNYLHETFGATREQFVAIANAGAAGKAYATDSHPTSMPGIMCWADATREMRDIFLPLDGWTKDETDNIPAIIHKVKDIKIAICNTDIGTGLVNYGPQPVRPKGDGVKRAVFPNELVFQGLLEGT